MTTERAESAIGPAWRAYADVLGVFSCFFAASAVVAVLDLAGRDVSAPDRASWATYGPAALSALAHAALAVIVVILLGGRRGLSRADLGLTFRRDEQGRVKVWSEIRLGSLAMIAIGVGLVLTAATTNRRLPLGPDEAANLVFRAARSIQAGVMEETIVLGFVVAVLARARRPLPEIFCIAVLLKVSYHLYYGVGAVGIAVWAALFVWLFWRTRSLLPLVAAHIWWDLVSTLGNRWPGVGGGAVLLTLMVLIAAGISWLVERAARPPADSMAPPGWYQDPAGQAQLRWWDGTAWSESHTWPSQTPATTAQTWSHGG